MRPAGLAAVDSAKADGRWEHGYARPASKIVLNDLTDVLAGNAAAAAFFQGMNKSDRYSLVWRVKRASPQGCAKRIEVLVQLLEEGKQPGGSVELVEKPKKASRVQNATPRTAVRKKTAPARRQVDSALSHKDGQTRQSRRKGLRRPSLIVEL